jgi:nucleoside-diphosphate-sugar epimerase
MHIAITGAPGFLGRYITNQMLSEGHTCRCWFRSNSDRGGFINHGKGIEWIKGTLNGLKDTEKLVSGVDAVIHAAVSWQGAKTDRLTKFVEENIIGTLRLMEEAHRAGVERFVFIASCAVHEVILNDRPLDEAHPLWPTSHYGAYKAAIEKFIHSYGFGQGWKICSLRPTGIYGIRRPIELSRWYRLIREVVKGRDITSSAGGKEVHAQDCAGAISVLLKTDNIAGQAYNCYDLYIAEQDVAQMAKDITGSKSNIAQLNQGCKHQIDTSKIKTLGMEFGGSKLLEQYIHDIVESISKNRN